MNKNSVKVTTTFQHYIVAYIDVLGQRAELAKLEELLDNRERGESILEAKRQTIDVIKKIRDDFHKFWEKVITAEPNEPWYNNFTAEQKDQYKKLRYGDIKFRYISDGIIMYAPLSRIKGEQRVQDILSILMATANLILVNLSKKVAIRGAIELSWATKLEDWTKNKEDADIYGPILARAHYLESKIADYPRIIVGDRLIDYLKLRLQLPDEKAEDLQERLNKKCAKQCRDLIRDDTDGQFIVDFLGPFMQKYTSTLPLAKAGYKFVQQEYFKYKQARDSQEIDSQAEYSKRVFRYAKLMDYFLNRLPNLDSKLLDEEQFDLKEKSKMAKQVQPGEDIHIAPGITGRRDESGELIIIVDSNGERLYPNKHIEDKIRIFERQVNGWFLERASNLLINEDNGFVILMIATAYIEGMEQYRQGKSSKRRSKSFFKKGIKRIFEVDSRDDNRLDGFYSELRCELFHNGMTGPNVRINSTIYDKDIDFSEGNIIKINQKLFLEKVKDDFEKYLKDLRDTTKTVLRDNFDKWYTF